MIIELLIFFIQSMAAHLAAKMVVGMLQEEPDEKAICPGSESESSDDDDPDSLPWSNWSCWHVWESNSPT